MTATLTSAPDNAVIAVSRYSWMDATDPIGNVASGNTNSNGACTGGSPSPSYSLELPVGTDGAVMYGAVARLNGLHNPNEDGGFRERQEVQQGSGSTTAGLAVEDAPARAANYTPTPTVNGTFGSNVDWAVIAIEIKPLP